MKYNTKNKNFLDVVVTILSAVKEGRHLKLNGRLVPLDKVHFNYREGSVKIAYWDYKETFVKTTKTKYEETSLSKQREFLYKHPNQEGVLEDVYHHFVGIRHTFEYKEIELITGSKVIPYKLEFDIPLVKYVDLPLTLTHEVLFDAFLNVFATHRTNRFTYEDVFTKGKEKEYVSRKRKDLGVFKFKDEYVDTRYSDVLIPKPHTEHISENTYMYDKTYFEFLLYWLIHYSSVMSSELKAELQEVSEGKCTTTKLSSAGYFLVVKDYWWKRNRGKRRKKTYERYN